MIFALPEVRWIFAALFAALLVASFVGYVLHRRRPSAEAGNLNSRIRAWWIMILIGGAVLAAGPEAIIVLFAILSFFALREFSPPSPGYGLLDDLVRLDSFAVALPIQYLLVLTGHAYGWFASWIPLCCLLLLPLQSLFQTGEARLKNRIAGLTICVYFLSHVPALLMLTIPGYFGRSALLALFLVLITQVSDVFQYIWGKLLGRHRIAPRLSPSKTVEGLIGGVASATALGVALSPITPFTPIEAGLLSFLIASMGFLGGLVLSAVKRARGIKDWGTLIEGHGGVLDRIDSLCFSAPVFFYVVRYFFSAQS